MKKIITFLFVIVLTTTYAQSPLGINYQSIIRNSAGTILPSTPVLVEFKLYNGLIGSLVYFEKHTITTNSFGMANVIIGQGIPITGTFNTINWDNGIAYEVYINSNLVGTKQLFMSVPYALFSPPQPLNLSGNVLSSGPTSNSVTLNSGTTYTNGIGISISSGTIISNTSPNQTVTLVPGNSNVSIGGSYPNYSVSSSSTLSLAGTSLSISNGNTVVLPNPGASTTITPRVFPNNNVLITGTAPSYTIGAPSYSITNPSTTNNLVITNGLNSSTVSVPSPTLGLTNGTLAVGSNSINLSNPINGFWSVKGNLGTLSANNFIGTTDAVDLNFRTSNVNRMTITSTGTVNINSNIIIPAANSYSYSSAKTNYLSIPGTAFIPENANVFIGRVISGQLFAQPITGTLITGYSTPFLAPVNLPDGAIITQIDAYVVDNSAGTSISSVQLFTNTSPIGSPFGSTGIFNTGSSSGLTSPNIQKLTVAPILTIDNINTSYFIRFQGVYGGTGTEQDIKLVRVLITYTVDKAD